MRILLIFIAYLLGALILAAILHYPLHSLLSNFWDLNPDRVYYRSAMLFAIIGFWPLLKKLNLANKTAIGLAVPRSKFFSQLLLGLMFGVMIIGMLSAALVLSGARVLDPNLIITSEAISELLLKALISGILVGLIEEIFFRGTLQSGMRRSSGLLATGTGISVLYAVLHFMRPSKAELTGWDSGFLYLHSSLSGLGAVSDQLDSVIALFAAGFFLSLVRERKGNIALAIGIHAGWVLAIKSTNFFTDVAPESSAHILIGNYDGIIGWLATGWLILLSLGYWMLSKPGRRRR